MSMALSPHERKINEVLAGAYRREGHNLPPATVPTPLDALLAAEEALPEDEQKIKEDFADKWLGFFFTDPTTGRHDPHPANVMKRLFFYVRAVRPTLLLNLPGEEIAALFGQGRGAESARCNLLLGKLKKKGGYRRLSLPFQKSTSAKQKYAAAQRGNKHRANSVRTTKAA